MTQQKQAQSYLVPFIIMVVLMSLVGLITNLNGQFQAPMKADQHTHHPTYLRLLLWLPCHGRTKC